MNNLGSGFLASLERSVYRTNNGWRPYKIEDVPIHVHHYNMFRLFELPAECEPLSKVIQRAIEERAAQTKPENWSFGYPKTACQNDSTYETLYTQKAVFGEERSITETETETYEYEKQLFDSGDVDKYGNVLTCQ
uniref:Uncharacterized protein n=1 Tax=Marseillevirus LCMAC202 TaxID=2506606 RepID=A0A481YXF6_9VIRU|nr:MAG: hypothetical protein LCMAC202_03040 [Marseillevirus LCMAC202]